jgi:hypothetical protein
MILWSCQICTKKDPVTGEEILPPFLDYTPYVIVRPNWWEFDIMIRNREKLDMMNR